MCRSWGQVEEIHLTKFRIEQPGLMRYYHSQQKCFNLPNGSRIAFKYGDTLDDITQLAQGPEAKYIFLDQAEKFSEEEIQIIQTCNRWPSTSRRGECKIVLGYNPGGKGTEFLRRVFWLKSYKGQERASDYAFIQAYGWDNYEWFRGHVPYSRDEFYQIPDEVPAYVDRPDDEWLATIPAHNRFKMFVTQTDEGRKHWGKPESQRMGELFGRFDSFAGQYFAGVWDERKCTISEGQCARLMQPWWVKWMALDWGVRHHAACYWFTVGRVSPSTLRSVLGVESKFSLDVVICYREFVAQDLSEFDLASQIVRMTPRKERGEIQRFKVGADVFAQRHGADHTICEQLESVFLPAGLPRLESADVRKGSRIAGARTVFDGFRRSTTVRGSDIPDDAETTPLLLIGPECPILVSSIPLLICDPANPEDVLKLETMQDDVYDGFRYGYVSYQEALTKAPVAVRRQEVFETYEKDRTDSDMTNVAMQIRIFDAGEKRSGRRIRRRR
jgi:hypothetical protein